MPQTRFVPGILCLVSIWFIAAMSRISASENSRAVLWVILNIVET